MIVNSLYSNMANNSAFNCMKASESLRRLCSFNSANYVSLCKADKNLTFQMYNESLMYKLATLLEKSQKKIKEENIKRTFSTFA